MAFGSVSQASSSLPINLSFSKKNRLRQSLDFKRVFQKGTPIRSPCLVFRFYKNSLTYARLGMVITKKAVPLATARNRLKRVIRESFLTRKNSLAAVDVVVVLIPNKAAVDTKLVRLELNKQWVKLTTGYESC